VGDSASGEDEWTSAGAREEAWEEHCSAGRESGVG